MTPEKDEQVRQAVAAYLEYAELGGQPPDFGDLAPEVLEEVHRVLAVMQATEGVALRSADLEPPDSHPRRALRNAHELARLAGSDVERQVLNELAKWLPQGTPVDVDGAHAGFTLPGLPVTASWIVGSAGGRIRVWLVEVPGAANLEADTSHLVTLDRVFRAFPETAALCLVGADLTSLLLEPHDCAPVIEAPVGGITGRRYRRPIQRLGEAVATFLREVQPVWEALPRLDTAIRPVDVRELAQNAASAAVSAQKALGARARYPKKEALAGLGEAESEALAELALALYESRRTADQVAGDLSTLGGEQ